MLTLPRPHFPTLSTGNAVVCAHTRSKCTTYTTFNVCRLLTHNYGYICKCTHRLIHNLVNKTISPKLQKTFPICFLKHLEPLSHCVCSVWSKLTFDLNSNFRLVSIYPWFASEQVSLSWAVVKKAVCLALFSEFVRLILFWLSCIHLYLSLADYTWLKVRRKEYPHLWHAFAWWRPCRNETLFCAVY